MSKIYDALRRAEEERRRAAGGEAASRGGSAPAVESGVPEEPLSSPLTPARRATPPPASRVGQRVEDDLATLRTTLENLLPGRERRVVTFASLGRGEGTTTMVAAFARLLAADRSLRVAVLDANVIAPGLARSFGAEPSPGFADLFSGATTPALALHAVDGLGIHVLPCGRPDPRHLHPDPAAIAAILHAFRGYHYVLVDAAPLLAWPYSAAVAAETDGVVLVVRWGLTKREVVGRGMEALAAADARVLGVVLNRRRYPIPDALYRRV